MVNTCPAVLVRARKRSLPLRTSALLDRPLPMNSITYVPRFFNSGNANGRRTRRIGASEYLTIFSLLATRPSSLTSVSTSRPLAR